MSKEIKDFANFDLQNEVADYFVDKSGRKYVVAEKDMVRDLLRGNGIRHTTVGMSSMWTYPEFTARQYPHIDLGNLLKS